MNYWPDVDGSDPELAEASGGTSTFVGAHFPRARVVESLNQLGYHEFEESPRERGSLDRIAVAAAGDDRQAVRLVMRLIDRLGFDPVDGGPLANGRLLEPDGGPHAETFSAAALSETRETRRPSSPERINQGAHRSTDRAIAASAPVRAA